MHLPVPEELGRQALNSTEAEEVFEGRRTYVPRSYFPYDLEAYANEAMLSWMNQYRNKYNETAYQEQISRYLDDAADTLTFLSNTAFPDPKLDLCRSLYPELVREREAEEVEDSAGRTRSTEVKRTRRDAQAPLPGTSSSSAGRSDPDGDGQIVVNRPPSGANRMYGSRKNPATYPSTTNATALAAWPWFVRKIFGGGGRVEESPREEQSSGDLGGERVDLEQPDTNEDDMAGDSSDEVGSDSSRARSSLHAAAVSRTRTRTSTSTSTTSLPKIHDPNYTPTEKWCREQLFPRQEDDEGSDGYGGSSLYQSVGPDDGEGRDGAEAGDAAGDGVLVFVVRGGADRVAVGRVLHDLLHPGARPRAETPRKRNQPKAKAKGRAEENHRRRLRRQWESWPGRRLRAGGIGPAGGEERLVVY
eukprot:CAMPEP_0178993728 /NCGR_PEP_ID=MMETSP0795-20121207/6868_1 /TAXON_ID=88552 /ORGANISM="Amoebophrya sp., Strain Ameob2" /LENGTH=416 /DNA_ID=CAMNT_0020685827 /DNA_START=396 /DNA_END=1645 /DNA_ORIENTATION=-